MSFSSDLESSRLIEGRSIASSFAESQVSRRSGGERRISSSANVITVRALTSDDVVPIMSNRDNGAPEVPCQVCAAQIALDSRSMQQHVIKCTYCGEATPIQLAPFGKRYVRCPCNCLLICKVTSQKIACPRRDCNRIINIVAEGEKALTTVVADSGTPWPVLINGSRVGNSVVDNANDRAAVRVLCAYCFEPFTAVPNASYDALYLVCLRCNRRSFADTRSRFKRIALFCGLALLMVIGGAVTIGLTFSDLPTEPALNAAWAAFVVLALIAFGFAIYFARIRVSHPF